MNTKELPKHGILITQGRWYYGLFLLDIPKSPGFEFGGDLNGCLWRFDDQPEHWQLDFRIRYNAGHNTSPWDYGPKGDRKKWFHIEFDCPQFEAIQKVRNSMIELARVTSKVLDGPVPYLDWLVVCGDSDRFIEAAQRQKKPWMHMRTEKMPT